jgi:NRPS condensation-like uncharacterized protein
VTDLRPASHAQHRLWLVQQLQPESVYYNLGFRMELTGRLDPDALREAFRFTAGRHDALRTTFVDVDGEPMRQVRTDWDDFEYDHRAGGTVDADEWYQDGLSQPHDLERGPLFRVRVLSVTPDTHLVAVYCHHLVADGSSMDMVTRDVFSEYRRLVEGTPADLPEPASYDSYVAHESSRLTGAAAAQLDGYWRHRLDAAATDLGLEVNGSDSADADEAGPTNAVVGGILLDPADDAAVRDLARRESASLFMVGLAAYAYFLARLAGRGDVIVGTPVNLRNEVELEDVVGLCVNTVPVRVKVAQSKTFRDLVARVRDDMLNDLEHADLPFDLIVNLLRPARRPGTHPLIQATFQLDPRAFARHRYGDLTVAPWAARRVIDPRFPPTARTRVGADFAIQAHIYVGRQIEGFLRLAGRDGDTATRLAREFGQLWGELARHADDPLVSHWPDVESEVDAGGPAMVRREPVEPGRASAETVSQLGRMWTELLGVSPGRLDDFFELGGHSLLASRLASRVRAEFGRAFTVGDVFAQPTFGQQAALIDSQPRLDQADIGSSLGDRYPLTVAQRACWGIEAVTGEDLVLWYVTVVDVAGGDPDELSDAVRAAIRRHPVLRTRIVNDADPVAQLCSDEATIIRTDLPDAAADPMTTAAQAIASVPAAMPDGPLAMFVIATTPSRLVLVLITHRCVWDAASRTFFLRTLAAEYGRSGPPESTPSDGFPTYALREARALDDPEQIQRMRELAARLSDIRASHPVVAAPVDDGPDVVEHRWARTVDAPTVQRLHAVARRHRVTPFMVFVTAWHRAFADITSGHPLILGTPVSMRESVGLPEAVGPLVNTLAVCLPFAADTVADRLAEVRSAMAQAFEAGDLPFDAVAGQLRELGQDPTRVFDVLVVQHDAWTARSSATATTFTVIDGAAGPGDVERAGRPMLIDLWDTGSAGYEIVCRAPTTWFDAEMFDRVVGLFEADLTALLSM